MFVALTIGHIAVLVRGYMEGLSKYAGGAIFRNGVEGMVDGIPLRSDAKGRGDFLGGFLAVVDHYITLGGVDKGLNMFGGAAGNAEDRMNVATQSELEGVKANGGGGTIDYQGTGLVTGRIPWLGKGKALV